MAIALRFHLFPFRTQKLSSIALKVLCWQRHGRIRSCRIQLFLVSSAVEHPAVNRRVVGSNPTRGAIWIDLEIWTIVVRFQGLFICENTGFFWKKALFEKVFQTEQLIAKNTGITVRTLEQYCFELLMFGFKICFFIIVIEIFAFKLIGCPVH